MRPDGYWFWVEPTAPPPTMREIASLVAERHHLSLAEMRSPTAAYRVSHPRQEAFALIYKTGRFSMPQIARFFRKDDHTTVLKGIRSYEARLAEHRLVAA